MFGYGSASGLLGDVKQVADTSTMEKATQQTKADVSGSFSKMQSITVGAFNKASENRALRKAEREQENGDSIGGLGDDRREELYQRIAREARANEYADMMKLQGYEVKGNYIYRDGVRIGVKLSDGREIITNVEEQKKRKEAQLHAKNAADAAFEYEYNRASTTLTDDQLIEEAGGKDAMWYVSDTLGYIGDGLGNAWDYAMALGESVAGVASELYGKLKGDMCNQTPFAECRGCPNRPKLVRKKPSPGLFDMLNALKNGLPSILSAGLDCPGLGNSLAKGDFKTAGGALAQAGITAGCKMAVQYGSAVAFEKLKSVSEDQYAKSEELTELAKNMQPNEDQMSAISAVMGKSDVSTEDMFAANAAIDAFESQQSSVLREASMASAMSGMSAVAAGGAGLIHKVVSNTDIVSNISASVVRTNNTRTKHRLTSSTLAALPGGMSVSTFKTSFAIDSIMTGSATPKCTRVRRHKSVSDSLM